jgi:hypothetical protein
MGDLGRKEFGIKQPEFRIEEKAVYYHTGEEAVSQ